MQFNAGIKYQDRETARLMLSRIDCDLVGYSIIFGGLG